MSAPATDIAPATGWYLRVTDLKQWDYCRRVVYYEYCLPGVRPTTYKMDAGIELQEESAEREARRSLSAYGITTGERHYHVALQSERLGTTARVDMVIDTLNDTAAQGKRRLIPVDFKLSRKEPDAHFRLQVACYGMMLEEQWGLPAPVGYIYLIPLRRAVAVELTTRLRRSAEKAIQEIQEMVATERMPRAASHPAQCRDCEFRRFCNDVL